MFPFTVTPSNVPLCTTNPAPPEAFTTPPAIVPPARRRAPLDNKAAPSRNVPPFTSSAPSLTILTALASPAEIVTTSPGGRIGIITSSTADGRAPPLQFAGSDQSPEPPVQVRVAAWIGKRKA